MPTTKQLIERWQNVERVLCALTPHQRRKRWDMGGFGYETQCGTVCCAAGYCGLDPWFRRRGFRMDFGPLDDGVTVYDYVVKPLGTPVRQEVLQTPSGQTVGDVIKFFGEGARDVFLDWRRRPVGQVIREVRKHIKALQSSAGESVK